MMSDLTSQVLGLSILTSQQKVAKADIVPHMTATNPYYFPVVIVPVLVLCLKLSIEVSKSTLPVTLQLQLTPISQDILQLKLVEQKAH